MLTIEKTDWTVRQLLGMTLNDVLSEEVKMLLGHKIREKLDARPLGWGFIGDDSIEGDFVISQEEFNLSAQKLALELIYATTDGQAALLWYAYNNCPWAFMTDYTLEYLAAKNRWREYALGCSPCRAHNCLGYDPQTLVFANRPGICSKSGDPIDEGDLIGLGYAGWQIVRRKREMQTAESIDILRNRHSKWL